MLGKHPLDSGALIKGFTLFVWYFRKRNIQCFFLLPKVFSLTLFADCYNKLHVYFCHYPQYL